jgi:hypothetical protein
MVGGHVGRSEYLDSERGDNPAHERKEAVSREKPPCSVNILGSAGTENTRNVPATSESIERNMRAFKNE